VPVRSGLHGCGPSGIGCQAWLVSGSSANDHQAVSQPQQAALSTEGKCFTSVSWWCFGLSSPVAYIVSPNHNPSGSITCGPPCRQIEPGCERRTGPADYSGGYTTTKTPSSGFARFLCPAQMLCASASTRLRLVRPPKVSGLRSPTASLAPLSFHRAFVARPPLSAFGTSPPTTPAPRRPPPLL